MTPQKELRELEANRSSMIARNKASHNNIIFTYDETKRFDQNHRDAITAAKEALK